MNKKAWWLIWQSDDDAGRIKAYSFESEPTNQDIAESAENGFGMVGYPVMAHTEQKAIELAFVSEYSPKGA